MNIHFMGIGGCGVSGLAVMAMDRGHSVSGCDISESPYFDMVKNRGGVCHTGHSEDHLKGVDLLVCSSAVPKSNIEILSAEERGIKVMGRMEFLIELLKDNFIIGVAGSHGKTTTTWMIYYLMKKLGFNPSVYAGGKSLGLSSVSAGNPWIVEFDESDGSMFGMKADILLITNLEHEHADFYESGAAMLKEFERYIFRNRPSSLIIGSGYELSDSLMNVFEHTAFPSRQLLSERKMCHNHNDMDFVCSERVWSLLFRGREFPIGSEYDPWYVLQNRAAALLSIVHYCETERLGIKDISIDDWEKFPGVDRRFQKAGVFKGVELIDDYAHHPSELSALINRAELKYRNFGLIFQPHRISRFSTFYDSFKEVLMHVEPLILLPVYTAGETISGRTSRELFTELKESGSDVRYFDSIESAGKYLSENIDKIRTSSVISAGAGDVNTVFNYLEKDEV